MSPPPPVGPLSRRALLAGLGLAPAAALAGCTGFGGLGQSDDTGNQQGYVGANGDFQAVPAAKRTAPVVLSGPSTNGDTVDVADWRGKLVVVNVWFASCAPCRKEAPHLATIAGELTDVQFLGINTEDEVATARAFEKNFGIPYPSLLDADSGQAVLALRGTIPPAAVPSTIVLDTQGRPAARIIGGAPEDVLRGLIADVQGSEGSA